MNLALDFTADVEHAWRAALAPSNPPPALDWIEENFRLSATDSAAPGIIVLDPWQRAILAEFDNALVSRIVVAASSQVGKTALGLALAAYSARHRPGPMLYVAENEIAAGGFSKDRVKPMLEANAADILHGRRDGGGQALGRYSFATGSVLNVVGANAPSGLSSRPALTAIATEVRGFPVSAGKNGDPLSMMLARGKSFPKFKAFIESSPGIEGRCRLTEEYELGDARRWHLKCPHCDHAAPISFHPEEGSHHVHFSPRAIAAAAIVCVDCGVVWSAAERLDAIRNGEFRATKTADDPSVVSFRFSELESLRSTIPSIVQRYQNARNHPERLQAFVNTCLGLPFDADGATAMLDETGLFARAENYDADVILPHEVLLVTAGIDVQPDRLEVQIVGHGAGNRHWSLSYQVLKGDTLGPSVWDALEDLLRATSYRHPLGGALQIHSAFVDSSDGNSTAVVYDWSAKQQMLGRKFHAIKGREGDRPIVVKSKQTAISKQNPFKLLTVGVDTAKTAIFAALNNDDEAFENRIFFPSSYTETFYAGLTAEKQIVKTDKSGVLVRRYVKIDRHTRNEPLDTLVYALACFHYIQPLPDWKYLSVQLQQQSRPRQSMQDVAARLKSRPGVA